jgi:hypothetical protein
MSDWIRWAELADDCIDRANDYHRADGGVGDAQAAHLMRCADVYAQLAIASAIGERK